MNAETLLTSDVIGLTKTAPFSRRGFMTAVPVRRSFLPPPHLREFRLRAGEFVVEQPHRIHDLAEGR